MSDTPEKEAAKPTEAVATMEKEEKIPEKPFNTDVLETCTVRLGRPAWDLYLEYKKEKGLEKMQQQPVHFTLTARSTEGLQEIRSALENEQGILGITLNGKTMDFTATFAQLQHVIRHPETHWVEGHRLDQ